MKNQLQYLTLVVSVLSVLMTLPVKAQINRGLVGTEVVQDRRKISLESFSEIMYLDEIESPVTTVGEWLAQIENLVQVTGVRVNSTESGLRIVLETAEGELSVPSTQTVGNALIVEIPNAVLSLPEGDSFEQFDPIDGIALVTVSALGEDRIQVAITGSNAPPSASVSSENGNLVWTVIPSIAQQVDDTDEDAIEIVATGEREEGSVVDNATTATRTDTPLRDIPQSIQVVPQQVLEDQQVIQLREVVRNVSGVVEGSNFGNGGDAFLIRGFQSNNILLDGIEVGSFNLGSNNTFRETANTERIEILKGPASVLFGTLEPGGIVNVVTKQPLSDPFYEIELQAGNFGLIRPSIDLSGPLNSDRTALYRLNMVYQTADDFRGFNQGIERFFIAPVLSFAITDNTDLTLNFEYLYDERPFDRGLTAFGDRIADIPFDRILGEPDDVNIRKQSIAGYRLEHQFNENWQLRNVFRYISTERQTRAFQPDDGLNEETGDFSRQATDQLGNFDSYALQTNIVGEFTTGSVEHQLLFGVDLFKETRNFDNGFAFEDSIINIFDPIYGAPRPSRSELKNERLFLLGGTVKSLGLYLQDQITLADNLKLLIGGRFDIVDQDSFFTLVSAQNILVDTTDQQQDEAFSPRIGIVYQPIEPLSLYASFSRSFTPNFGTTVEGNILEPTRGTQYEVGVRGEFLEGRLTTNLATYYLTKTNIAATDPNNPDFSIATGEHRSRGIELDVIGEILPGWNIIASYAYTDAIVTQDEGSPLEGNRLAGVPENATSLWSTYEIQSGDLQGLGFGLGLFFVGERQGDLNNSFRVPSYVRTDASIFYRRNNWRAGLNFRNLFNIDYIEAADTRSRITPGAPFTVIGSVSVEF